MTNFLEILFLCILLLVIFLTGRHEFVVSKEREMLKQNCKIDPCTFECVRLYGETFDKLNIKCEYGKKTIH